MGEHCLLHEVVADEPHYPAGLALANKRLDARYANGAGGNWPFDRRLNGRLWGPLFHAFDEIRVHSCVRYKRETTHMTGDAASVASNDSLPFGQRTTTCFRS